MDFPTYIPDALKPVLAGLALWFGLSWLITPTLMERAVNIHAAPLCEQGANAEVCSCILNSIKHDAFDNTVLVSTLGLSDSRVRLLGDPNPIIQYALLEVENPMRLNACVVPGQDNDESHAIKLAELAAREQALALETQRQQFLAEQQEAQRQFDAATEQQAQERQRLLDEANRKLEELAEQAADNPLTEHAKEKLEQAKRVYELQNDSTNISLDAWETANDYARQKIRRWRYRYGQ